MKSINLTLKKKHLQGIFNQLSLPFNHHNNNSTTTTIPVNNKQNNNISNNISRQKPTISSAPYLLNTNNTNSYTTPNNNLISQLKQQLIQQPPKNGLKSPVLPVRHLLIPISTNNGCQQIISIPLATNNGSGHMQLLTTSNGQLIVTNLSNIASNNNIGSFLCCFC